MPPRRGPCYHEDPNFHTFTFDSKTIFGKTYYRATITCVCGYVCKTRCFEDAPPLGAERDATIEHATRTIIAHGEAQRKRASLVSASVFDAFASPRTSPRRLP